MLYHNALAPWREASMSRACRAFVRTITIASIIMLAGSATALAQLSGSYDVGGAGDPYANIESAITALNANGVSGAVEFRINGGTHTPPVGGYVLSSVPSMSATNTVTFRPKAGASVTIDGDLASAIITINGGDFYIIDGANGTSATRDMKIINRDAQESVITLNNGATNNIVRNIHAMGVSTSSTDPIIKIYTSSLANGPNAFNRISSNLLGDTTGTLRSAAGYYQFGTSAAQNTDNTIENNDIVNYGQGTGSGYGIYLSSENKRTHLIGNRISVPNKGTWTGASYGIYFTNSDAEDDSIAGNRIWNHQSSSATGTVYGIYISSTLATRVMYIANNMVAITTTGAATAGALYISSSVAADIRAYFNSFFVSGTGAGTALSYGIYQSTAMNLTLRNSIIVNTRSGTGTNTNRAIYRNGTTGTLSSNYNSWYYGAGTSGAMGYQSSVYYSTLAGWQALGYDANSVQGDPQFIDAANGDLHISTTLSTPVEGKGVALAGFSTDFDGNTRHSTRPDVGADEGTFTLLRNNDLEAASIFTPLAGTTLTAGVLFTPLVAIGNAGSNSQTGINVRMIIRDINGITVYEDVAVTGTIVSGARQQVTFAQTGSVTGSTALTAGAYTVELRTELTGDDDNTNDTLTSNFITKAPLSGTYTINASGSGSRNYPTFTSALREMRDVGMIGAVTFEIASGTYSANETFPIRVNNINGLTSTNTLTFRPASGASVVIIGTGSPSIFELDSADYVTLDGSNTIGGTSRDWSITNLSTSEPTVRLKNGATRNVIRNMVLMGSSSTSSDAIVNFGTTNTGVGNSYNLITANTIGDVTGTVRSGAGIYSTGTSTAYNTGNVIDDNDIVNFATGSSTGYGIYTSGSNQRIRISRNRISIPIKGTTTGGSYGIYWTNTAALLDTIANNKIWDLETGDSTDSFRGIYISSTNADNMPVIVNNMITLITRGPSTVAGIYIATSSDTARVYNNSVYIGGLNSGSDASYTFYLTSGGDAYLHNNVLVNERTGTGSGTNRVIYKSSATSGFLVSDRNVVYSSGTGTSFGYSGGARATFADWQNSGFDASSIVQRPRFVDQLTGDLHLDHLVIPYRGEGVAMRLPVPVDFDLQIRDTLLPDIGADEGDFNGGGLALQFPNGGEQFPVDYDLSVRFTANRPVPMYIELSEDAGQTWTRYATIPRPLIGANIAVINLPNREMTTARVRVISQLNAYEADTSNASFSLMRPIFVMRSPNGGERYVPTDTIVASWTAQFMPANARLDVDHSTDGGATWTTIFEDVPARNLPDTNRINWIVPNLPGTNNLFRVQIPGSRSVDASNATFTITMQPSVSLLSLNDGGRIFAGESVAINWTSVNTANIRLEYSLDGGATWSNLLPGGVTRLGAGRLTYPWTVPYVNSANSLVRVVNNERTRFVDFSNIEFEIVTGRIAVLSPNGGEQFDLSEPVTVRFDAPHSQTLRLDYSNDGGATWFTIDRAVDARSGSYTFTPAGIPTRRGLVRLVDESRASLADVSDGAFQIMESPSIVIFNPSTGEQIMRSSVYPITWQANRVARVNIEYNANGGAQGSWTRLASDVSAAMGTFNWNVPAQNTSMGVIRISEVGGTIVGSSGEFSIVDPITSVRLIRPNGGEVYTAGDEIIIGWSAVNIPTVTFEYSSDGGATWRAIDGVSLPGAQGTYRWIASGIPSTEYRVRVVGGAFSDVSDANFEIARRVIPTITVGYPNGGERLAIDSTIGITWVASDITGDVTIAYSIDNGSNWIDIATTPVALGAYQWKIPPTISEQVLVRITGNGAVSDVSDAPFAIEQPIVRMLTLSSPNAPTVIWREGQTATVSWSALNIGNDVSIMLSTDDGASWPTTITATTAASSGTFSWQVPHLSDALTTTLRVMVASLDGVYSDTSDASFTFEPLVAGIESPTTGSAGLRLSGAFPNPFATETEVRWHQTNAGSMSLRVYNQSGALVREYALGHLGAGTQSARIDAALLPAGLYVYELRSERESVRGTMNVVR